MTTIAQISLGSNLGDRDSILRDALRLLAETPGVEVVAVSTFHETDPVGGPADQGPFLNAAATLRTSLPAEALLAQLQLIESRLARTRQVRWAARTLDLDLLLFGDEQIRTDRLEVPHPRFALRRFVLDPLAEIAPDAIDPITRRTISDLAANLRRRPRRLTLIGGGPEADGFFQRLRDALSPAGWHVIREIDPAPTFFVAIEGRTIEGGGETVGEIWRRLRIARPGESDFPPVPVYRLDASNLGPGFDEVVAIARGIWDG